MAYCKTFRDQMGSTMRNRTNANRQKCAQIMATYTAITSTLDRHFQVGLSHAVYTFFIRQLDNEIGQSHLIKIAFGLAIWINYIVVA